MPRAEDDRKGQVRIADLSYQLPTYDFLAL